MKQLRERIKFLEEQMAAGDRESRVVLLTAPQVAGRLSVSTRTLWRMVREHKIPQPVRFNRKLVRWRLADLKEAGL